MGLFPEPPVTGELEEEKEAREEECNDEHTKAVRDLRRAKMKIFANQRKFVTNNLTILW